MATATAAVSRLGSRTTAEEALRGADLRGKRAIVTGASSGLGVETTRVLALAGAHVVVACRDRTAGERIAAELRTRLPSTAGALEVRTLDLADLDSVARFVDGMISDRSALDLLVNNAGVMATPLSTTQQGFELQIGTNHLGHFALTRGLLPRLEATPGARVVTVSSSLHTRGRGARLLATLEDDPTYARRRYSPFDAYGDSKLANILFTRKLAELVPTVSAYALHPGVIPTNLSRSMGAMGAVFRAVGRAFMKTIPQGAATTIYAATAPELEGRSGVYLADCAVATPSEEARDGALADRLWTVSEALVAGF